MQRRSISLGLALLAILAELLASLYPPGADRAHVVLSIALAADYVATDQAVDRSYLIDSQNGRMLTLDIDSGHIVSAVNIGMAGSSAIAGIDAHAGHIFVAQPFGVGDITRPARISMFAAVTGRLLRAIRLPVKAAVQEIQINARAERVFTLTELTSSDGALVCVLNSTTGALVGCDDVSHYSNASHTSRHVAGERYTLAIDQRSGHVFVADAGTSTVLMLDGVNGQVLRRDSVPFSPGYPRVDERTERVFISSTTDGSVGIFDARSGHLLRTTIVVQSAAQSGIPIILNTPTVDARTNRVFVYSISGTTVAMFDAHTGRLLRVTSLSTHPFAAFADEESNRVFIATSSRTVVILDGANGRIVRTVMRGCTFGFEGGITIAQRTGRVYLADIGAFDRTGKPTSAGKLYILDGHTGTTLTTIPVGVWPVAVALNDSNDHALVINEGGMLPLPDSWAWMPIWLRRHFPFLPRYTVRTRMVPPTVSVLDVEV